MAASPSMVTLPCSMQPHPSKRESLPAVLQEQDQSARRLVRETGLARMTASRSKTKHVENVLGG